MNKLDVKNEKAFVHEMVEDLIDAAYELGVSQDPDGHELDNMGVAADKLYRWINMQFKKRGTK